MIGGLKPQETGIPDEWVNPLGISCNPIVQAEIMNREGTELNFIYGLCVGHDTIFIKRSKAPVTYVVAKDMVTGNNPGAVLLSPYHRMKLVATYGRGGAAKEKDKSTKNDKESSQDNQERETS
jgi:uncharacterized metal-binding protein